MQKVNNPKIYLGNEIYLSENIIDLVKQNKAVTLDGTKYILFEMPLNGMQMGLLDMVYECLQNKLIPILAHPERYTVIQRNPNLTYELIEKGVLMQGNFGSVIGQYGKKAQIVIKKLLENNMIHFLGSDVHRMKTVYLKMPQILAKLNQLIGEEKVKTLTTINPRLALANQKIPTETPTEIKFSIIEKMIMQTKK